MSEDWSEKWYKQAFARSSAGKPKAEVWKHIESSLNSWFKRWYQSGAAGQSAQPKAEVWEALSAYVDQGLLLRRQLRWRILRSVSFAVLFLVLPLSLTDQFSENTVNGTGQSAQSDGQRVNTAQAANNNGAPQGPDAEARIEQAPQVLLAAAADFTPEPITPPPAQIEVPDISENNGTDPIQNTRAFEPVDRLSTRAPSGIEGTTALSSGPEYADIAARPFSLPKWIVAGSAVYQHSNLYNETTRMGFNRTSHIINESKPNFSVDLAVMRRLSTRSLLSLSVRINDVKGQVYHDFEGAEYLSKSLICTYQTLALNYHRSLLRSAKIRRINLEASGGIYGSFRSKIHETVGWQDREFLSPGIRKFDLGLQCGLQSVFQISEPVQLTLGAYYTNGLINIFKGVDKVPANFYTSYTASYGLSLGLRYQLK